MSDETPARRAVTARPVGTRYLTPDGLSDKPYSAPAAPATHQTATADAEPHPAEEE